MRALTPPPAAAQHPAVAWILLALLGLGASPPAAAASAEVEAAWVAISPVPLEWSMKPWWPHAEVTHRFKGGPYRGCFHVPRALGLCWRLLQKLENEP